jgi:hypothetical protein
MLEIVQRSRIESSLGQFSLFYKKTKRLDKFSSGLENSALATYRVRPPLSFS